MKECVEELAGQAFQYASDHADDSGKGSLGVFAEKFAELIVREVLDQVDEFSRLTKAYQTQGIDPEIDITKEVLKNFGFTRFPRS